MRASAEAEVTLGTLVTGIKQRRKAGRALTKWKRNGRARPNFSPKPFLNGLLLKEDPKTVTVRLDQPLAPAGIPNGPPQSPELRNTDA